MRSVSLNNEQRDQQRSAQNTPTPGAWDNQTVRERPRSRESAQRQRDSKDSRDYPRDYPAPGSARDGKESQRERIERYGSARSHGRHGSNGTGTGPGSSQGDYEHGGRRHDYDVQAMETDLSSPRVSVAKRPIPPPTVTVRSEYPTLVRSKQSQTLTCLITVEVPEGKWQPDPEDLRGVPPLPNIHHHHQSSQQQEKEVVQGRPPQEEVEAEWMTESPEELEEITEDLRVRVENWHGLDFSRYLFLYAVLIEMRGCLPGAADLESYGCTGNCV